MNKKELKQYLGNHPTSLFFLGFGTFVLIFLVYGGAKILTDDTITPFSLERLTFLVATLWGLELFRFFGKASEDAKKQEDKKISSITTK